MIIFITLLNKGPLNKKLQCYRQTKFTKLPSFETKKNSKSETDNATKDNCCANIQHVFLLSSVNNFIIFLVENLNVTVSYQ